MSWLSTVVATVELWMPWMLRVLRIALACIKSVRADSHKHAAIIAFLFTWRETWIPHLDGSSVVQSGT